MVPLDHANLLPRRHLDRLSRFYRAYDRDNRQTDGPRYVAASVAIARI